MAIFQDAQTDSADLAKLVNEDTDVTTRYGAQPKKSIPKVLREFEEAGESAINSFNQESAESIAEFDQVIDQYKESRGFNTKGTFAAGFTYELPNDVGLDGSGNPWILIDTSSLPVTVNAGTTPTNPPFKQVAYGTASQVSTNTSDTVQSFADSFALKIFQSPTDGRLTEINTRTVNAGEVYEVRKVSDDSLATIYSDTVGPTEIMQNSTDNVSGSDGVVEFYIGDGDYYIEVGSVTSNFLVGVDSGSVANSQRVFKSVNSMLAGVEQSSYKIGDLIKVSNGILKPLEFIVTSEATAYPLSGGLFAKLYNTESFKDYVMSMQSCLSLKPDIKNYLEDQFNQPLLNRFSQFIPAANYDPSLTSGAVMGSGLTSNTSTRHEGVLVIGVPASGSSSGSWSASVTIDELTGVYANLVVTLRQYYTKENGGGFAGGGVSLTRSGNTYTLSPTTFNDVEGTVLGLQIETTTGEGLFHISDFSITDNTGAVYTAESTSALNETVITFAWSQSTKGIEYNSLSNGVELRCLGCRSGWLPSAVYSSPYAVDDSNAGTIRTFEMFGLSSKKPMIAYRAFQHVLTYYNNSVKVPKLILAPGNYTNSRTLEAVFEYRYTDAEFWTRREDFFIGCPQGVATISAGVNRAEAFVFGTVSDAEVTKMHLLNINVGSDMSRPFRFNNVDLMAYNCHSSSGDTSLGAASGDGWELDNNNNAIQACSATGAENDGFNHHGFGKTVLIDCVSHDNLDDGFSPHDECEFEVWGGEYYNNGKGNIIPAFGARGFCHRVKSYGCTGLSTRVDGNNYGGFVCLSIDVNARKSMMYLFDCETDNDILGINSAGSQSTIWAVNTESTNQTLDLSSGVWGDSTGGSLYYADGTDAATQNNPEKILIAQ